MSNASQMAAAPLPAAEQVPRSVETQTDEPIAILGYATEWFTQGAAVALATLVDIRTGAARSLGAQMAVREDGLFCGLLSGGCLEGAIAAEAMIAMREGRDREVLLGEGSPYLDIQLPCGGGVTVAIHVLRSADALAKIIEDHAVRTTSGLRYDSTAQDLTYVSGTGPDMELSPGGFVRRYRPRTRLIVSGGGLEAEAVSRIAAATGYDVVRFAPRSAPLGPLDEQTAFVVLHHDIDAEIGALQAALASRAFYVGALGSRATHARRTERLLAMGYDEAEIGRLKAPIGLVGRTRDASSLAISILADIVAARHSERVEAATSETA